MRHFPIFLELSGRRVAVSGAGPVAVPKLRLLLKTDSNIAVYGRLPAPQVREWATDGRVELFEREIESADVDGAALLYCANDDPDSDSRAAAMGKQAGALVNIVDNLDDSEFITPAIVDRDPVVVAIGTEGAAPVLARKLKSDFELQLPTSLGPLAEAGRAFRSTAARLQPGRGRREFWAAFFEREGPEAYEKGGFPAAIRCLGRLFRDAERRPRRAGMTAFVGVGPGDPALMTLQASRFVDGADVIVHDASIPESVLEMARREAEFVDIGRSAGSEHSAEQVGAMVAKLTAGGRQVARLVLGGLGEHPGVEREIAAVRNAGVELDLANGLPSFAGPTEATVPPANAAAALRNGIRHQPAGPGVRRGAPARVPTEPHTRQDAAGRATADGRACEAA